MLSDASARRYLRRHRLRNITGSTRRYFSGGVAGLTAGQEFHLPSSRLTEMPLKGNTLKIGYYYNKKTFLVNSLK